MSNAALLSYFGVESLNLKNQATPFASRMLSGERRAVGAPITVENLRRHSSGGPYQYSRSISLQATSKSVVLPQDHGDSADSVFRSSNKENRPRAFSESDRKPQNSDRYKTELCRPFEESGTCKYGDKCQFAHGIQELRNLVRHPKYKTELCRTYHTVGICPYGPRCHFIHNPDELAHFSKPCNKDRTVGKPKLLHFPSAPLGSTGDLTPPGSVCDSPMSPLGDNFLEILKDEARKLICVDQSDFSTFTPSLLSTIPSPITSEPASPFLSESTSHYSYDTMQLKDNVFFPSEDSKPPSPVGYRPPSPPDSDPESYCESAPSPVPLVFSGPTYAAQSSPSPRNSRLPIFRGISMDENLIH